MIRPLTLLAAMLAIGSGYYLYLAKHRTRLIDQRIAAIVQETADTQTRIAVLRAEWALENSPSRLADLAARYLLLAPMQPSQAVSLADLAAHLPPQAEPGATRPAVAQPDVPAQVGLGQAGLYASLDYFVPASAEVHPSSSPLAVAAAPAPFSPQPPTARQALAAAGPSSLAALSLPASPEPAATPSLPLKPARPALAAAAAARPAPPRQLPLPVLTSALGGAYPELPPPAPLSGSH